MRIILKAIVMCGIFGFVCCHAGEKDIRVVVAEVVKVVDGDTINVIVANTNEKLKIRLYGIDAPERKQKFGKKAKDTLNRLIGEKIVTLYIFGDDKYQRKIAKVMHDDKYINLLMIRLGYAWYYEEFASDKDLMLAEEKARGQRVGLWNSKNNIKPYKFRDNI